MNQPGPLNSLMDAATTRLIEALHAVPWKCALAVTGGGTQAGALLSRVEGLEEQPDVSKFFSGMAGGMVSDQRLA